MNADGSKHATTRNDRAVAIDCLAHIYYRRCAEYLTIGELNVDCWLFIYDNDRDRKYKRQNEKHVD